MNTKTGFDRLRRMCELPRKVTHVERVIQAWICTNGSDSIKERMTLLSANLNNTCLAELALSGLEMSNPSDVGLGISIGTGVPSELREDNFVPREFIEALKAITAR